MKRLICNLYSFDELSKDAQYKVCEEERNKTYGVVDISMSDDAAERRKTLDKFCDVFGIKYQIISNVYNSFVSWHFKDEELECKADKICGKYLWRFLDKHYYDICSRKYFSTRGYFDENRKYHYKFRRSRITWEVGDCPFTGMCYDVDILEAIFDWYNKPDWDLSLRGLFERCFSRYLKYWDNEDEYRMSDENIGDMIVSSYPDRLYFVDGTEFEGNYDECVYYIEEGKSA